MKVKKFAIKLKFLFLVSFLFLITDCIGKSAQAEFDFLYPMPQIITAGEGIFKLNNVNIYVDESFLDEHNWLIEGLEIENANISPLTRTVKFPAIVIGRISNPVISGQIDNLGLKMPAECEDEEGYIFAVRESNILIAAKEDRGIFYGIQTLKQFLCEESSKTKGINCVTIYDWPDLSMRAFHYMHCRDLWFPETDTIKFNEEIGRKVIERLAELKMNTIILVLGNTIKWKSHPEISLNDAWSIERFKKFIDFIKKHKLKIIPEFNLSTMHDTWLGKYGFEIDSPRYRKTIEDLISETLDLIGPPVDFFHLGWDEEDTAHYEMRKPEPLIVRPPVGRWKSYSRFLNFLDSKNLDGIVWSDILCERDSDFRWEWNLLDEHQELLEIMQKHSVFMDWWPYARNTYEITQKLLDRGCRVIIATNIRTKHEKGKPPLASKKAKELKESGVIGVCQSVWYPMLPGEGARKHFEALNVAAGPFWNADNPGKVIKYKKEF